MIKSIVVVGGGAAGWITAGLLAAKYNQGGATPLEVRLVESETIGIIGVGEGTWPTMVDTLKKLGIPETEFLAKCDASFKQASKFCGWRTGDKEEYYYHPFSLPQEFEKVSLAAEWREHQAHMPFAEAVGIQAELCERKRAPKQARSPDYASVENHGYHLNAGKFTRLLTEHCTTKLGVIHHVADVVKVNGQENGDIKSLSTAAGEEIAGDLFIDCSGSAGILIDKFYHVPLISQKDVLFIDKALAVQVPYKAPNDEIESATISTAQTAGWIWDIGLPSRRGVGHVFSSKYISVAAAAAQLRDYLRPDVDNVEDLIFRELDITPGYREKFWINNCVAVGMSAGFLEPLEASALVMVELAANTISLHLPASRETMDVVAKKYNETFLFRWGRVIDFLKLHYVLSERTDGPFWTDNRKEQTIPESLRDLLTLWRHQSPANNGFLSPYDIFPAASYQYILYGMGFVTQTNALETVPEIAHQARKALAKVAARKEKVPALLPGNRALITALMEDRSAAVLDLETMASTSWQRVAWSDMPRVGQKHPLFLKRDQGTGEVFGVALLGLARNEILCPLDEIPSFSPQDATHQDAQEEKDLFRMLTAQGDLLEPVKLDIQFDDKSSIVITGLHVINKDKLAGVSSKVFGGDDGDELMSLLATLQGSLQHMSGLISRKNKGL